MKKLLLLALWSPSFVLAAPDFVDEADFSAWSEDAIKTVNQQGIMTGFGDGTFRPDQTLNRAEAVTILLRVKNIDPSSEGVGRDFDDVPGDAWFNRAVTRAAREGWLKGKSNGRFAPGDTLNRAEWATLLDRAFDLDRTDQSIPFRDVPERAWFADGVRAMIEENMIRHPKVRMYFPEKEISRAEAAWTIARLLASPSITGEQSDTGLNRRNQMRRVAIRPKDFNAQKQAADIDEKALEVSVQKANTETIEIVPDDTWSFVGNLRLKNELTTPAIVTNMTFKINFERPNIGPDENFSLKFENADGATIETKEFGRTGQITLTELDLTLLSQEEIYLPLYVLARSDESYFTTRGSGKIFLSQMEVNTTKTFTNGTKGQHFTIPEVKSRDFSTFDFSPVR